MSHPLFVYGTLMRHADRGFMLSGLRRRPARTQGLLFALPAGYPALAAGSRTVFGELIEGVSNPMLSILDAYEGVGAGLYERRRINVQVDTEHINAWAYCMDDARERGGRLLPRGRFEPVRKR